MIRIPNARRNGQAAAAAAVQGDIAPASISASSIPVSSKVRGVMVTVLWSYTRVTADRKASANVDAGHTQKVFIGLYSGTKYRVVSVAGGLRDVETGYGSIGGELVKVSAAANSTCQCQAKELLGAVPWSAGEVVYAAIPA